MNHLLIFLTASTVAFAQPKPNILFIAIDDFRPELGCYGSPEVKTPHLDKFAAQSMRFDRAYCQVTVCGASRASLLTGILPTPKRFRNYDTRVDTDAPNAPTLPQVFREAGYTVIANGKIFHHSDDAEERSWSKPAWTPKDNLLSFDPETTRRLSKSRSRGRIFESPDVPDNAYPDGQIAEKTIRDLQGLKQSDKPFFLACGFLRPHLPFYAPKKYWDLYDREKIEVADNLKRPENAPKDLQGSPEFRFYHLGDFNEKSEAFHRMMRHGYLACTSYVDKLVGDVLAELEQHGLAEHTIVVIWGDHGFHLGEHNFWGKHNTLHLATRVPLILKVPGKKAGTTSSLVESSDIFPTLCQLADLEVPATVQGRSFVNLLEKPDQPFRDVAYSRYLNADAVITNRFTYTSYHKGKSEMLYDLENDPQENTNVADRPENATTLARARTLLKERIDESAK